MNTSLPKWLRKSGYSKSFSITVLMLFTFAGFFLFQQLLTTQTVYALDQFQPKNKYFDEKATRETPRWFNVDVKLVKKTRLVGLPELRGDPKLESLRILQKGNRLSITPVTPAEWKIISKLAEQA